MRRSEAAALSRRSVQGLLLVLYCTGIRFGEALRLRIRDVNTRAAVLFVDTFKGRARWVPFHRSLARALDRYLTARVKFAPTGPDPGSRRRQSDNTAREYGEWNSARPVSTRGHETGQGANRTTPIRPSSRLRGPPVEPVVQTRREPEQPVPWLSAYMGHVDIVGTETYLNATPELLGLAANRLRRRFRESGGGPR